MSEKKEVLFVRSSGNKKTGPIPNVYMPSSTCPSACPLRPVEKGGNGGCYAAGYPTALHWGALDRGERGISWEAFLMEIRALPKHQVWRMSVAGDLPGEGDHLDTQRLGELVEANLWRKGYGYSHKPVTEDTAPHIRKANERGLVINLSANTLAEADELMALKVAPVVLSMPEHEKDWPTKTATGIRVVPCPAVTKPGVTCETCRLCSIHDRKVVIGFPSHGKGKRQVEATYNQSILASG
jgi:hypothetical protein